MPLMNESDQVARRPRRKGSSKEKSVWAHLPDSFFTEMKAKPHRSAIADYRWAYDNRLEYEAMVAQWDGEGEGRSWERLYRLLQGAPGKGAVTLLQTLVNDDEKGTTLMKVMAQLAKGDDEEEDAKRQRDARTRFGVISRLRDVGRPVPPWLDRETWEVVG